MYRTTDIHNYVYDVADMGLDTTVTIDMGHEMIKAVDLTPYAAAQLVVSAVGCAYTEVVEVDAVTSSCQVRCYHSYLDYESELEHYGVYFDEGNTNEWIGRNGDLAYGKDLHGRQVLLVYNGGCR